MGRKLDALLCRKASRTAKLKVLLGLTVSRLAILKNRSNVRSSHASDDIVVLLQSGYQERAILRAEYVIKEQNMVDVFVMVEGYCNLLVERSILLELNSRDQCPDELKEAIASLMFVASRSGELLELHDVRPIFTSWYGNELAKAAVELHSGCGVNPKIVQKMLTKQADLESRLKVVNSIASKNGLSFDLEDILPRPSPANPATGKEELTPELIMDKREEDPSSPNQRLDVSPKASRQSKRDLEEDVNVVSTNSPTEQLGEKWLFTDATSAAQAAFESATVAAAAARAAIELYRQGSRSPHGKGSHSGATQQPGGGLHHLATPGSGSEREREREREAMEEEGATRDHEVPPPPPIPQVKEANEEEMVESELDPERRRSDGEFHSMQKPYSVRTRRGRS